MNRNKKAYCFDFDETIALTDSKIYVYRNGIFFKKLTPKEYSFYKPDKRDTLDFSEFNDSDLILNAKKYKMWPVIRNVYNAVKEGRSNSEIYIITGRNSSVKAAIYQFLKKNGIIVDIDHIITVGDDSLEKHDISKEKRKWLEKISRDHYKTIFFDDDPDNIRYAMNIENLETRLVEDMGGAAATTGGVTSPMATLMNTPGMGDAVPPKAGSIGSGDTFGMINRKPYTQGNVIIKKKTKKKKRKLVRESLIEIIESKVNEEDINPYDKIGVEIAKKLKVKLPLKKKKSKNNQNSMKLDI